MLSKKLSIWKSLYYLSTVVVIILAIACVTFLNIEQVTAIMKLSAKVGMGVLAIMFAMKNIALAHPTSKSPFITLLKKQLRDQREQGLIAFNLFFIHALATFSLYIIKLQLNFGMYLYVSFTAIIPTVLMIYLYVTSFKPVQNRVKKWKKSHTLGWLLFGTVIAHELLLTQKLELTTFLTTLLAIGTMLYGLFYQKFNKRTMKQLIVTIVGFVLIIFMFVTNELVEKAIREIGYTKQAEVLINTTQSGYKDGKYTGSGRGFGGVIKVDVVIENTKIKTITIVEESETPEYFEQANPKIINDIIKKQTPNVTAVSGATRSSEGIKNAVSQAVQQAK